MVLVYVVVKDGNGEIYINWFYSGVVKFNWLVIIKFFEGKSIV